MAYNCIWITGVLFMSPIIKILIADDHPLLRESLHKTLSNQRDMKVVGEAGDGNEVVRMAEELKPDIIIMDIMMPTVNGIEASKQIKKDLPNIAILILTAYDDDNYVLGLLEAGAAGYLLKSARGQDIVNAIMCCLSSERADGQVLNVGSGKRTTIEELASCVLELTGSDVGISYEEPREGDIEHSYADISKIGKLIGYRPRLGLRDGLRQLLSEESVI